MPNTPDAPRPVEPLDYASPADDAVARLVRLWLAVAAVGAGATVAWGLAGAFTVWRVVGQVSGSGAAMLSLYAVGQLVQGLGFGPLAVACVVGRSGASGAGAGRTARRAVRPSAAVAVVAAAGSGAIQAAAAIAYEMTPATWSSPENVGRLVLALFFPAVTAALPAGLWLMLRRPADIADLADLADLADQTDQTDGAGGATAAHRRSSTVGRLVGR